MPPKPSTGSKRKVDACEGVKTIPPGLAARTAAVKLAKPAVQVAPAGVGGQVMLNTPADTDGKDVMVYDTTTPSGSLPVSGVFAPITIGPVPGGLLITSEVLSCATGGAGQIVKSIVS